MSVALPLRILLVLALVLNGIGGAMAGVLAAMPSDPAAPHVMADGQAPRQADDCHGQEAIAGEHGQQSPIPVPDCHATDAGDCGDTAECRQACMHAAAAVPCLPGVSLIQVHAAALVPPLAVGHPAPALPSPIRPPIA
ncbi:MAG TPA: CopL family metal-binding regulatory protein [Luteimonas sp.]